MLVGRRYYGWRLYKGKSLGLVTGRGQVGQCGRGRNPLENGRVACYGDLYLCRGWQDKSLGCDWLLCHLGNLRSIHNGQGLGFVWQCTDVTLLCEWRDWLDVTLISSYEVVHLRARAGVVDNDAVVADVVAVDDVDVVEADRTVAGPASVVAREGDCGKGLWHLGLAHLGQHRVDVEGLDDDLGR